MSWFRRPAKIVILTVAIIGLLFFLHFTRILRPVESGLRSLTQPILRGGHRLSVMIGEYYFNYRSQKSLIQENKQLRDQLLILEKQRSLYLTEKEENDFFRQQLNFVRQVNYDYTLARVVGETADRTQSALILDQGARAGVRLGLAVVTEEGVLIGKITKVSPNQAWALLVNDDLSKVAVKIQNPAHTLGVLEGEFGLGLKMRLIPRTETVSEGDTVVTSGLEATVPSGLMIGRISAVQNEQEELFQEAVVKSAVDLNRITLVNIIKYNLSDDSATSSGD